MIFSWARETHILCRQHTLCADKPLRGCTGGQENKSKIKEHFQGCWGSALTQTPARRQLFHLSPGASLITSGCDWYSWRTQPGWKHLGTAGFAVSGTCKGFSSKPAWKQSKQAMRQQLLQNSWAKLNVGNDLKVNSENVAESLWACKGCHADITAWQKCE